MSKIDGLDGNKFYMVASKRQPIWIAEVTGLDAQYGLKRNFLPAKERGTVSQEFTLKEDTFYAWKLYKEQEYGHFIDDTMHVMTSDEIVAALSSKAVKHTAEPANTEFVAPTYYVNQINGNDGVEPHCVEKAINSLIRLGKLESGISQYKDYNCYAIAEVLSGLHELHSWAEDNYTPYTVREDYTAETKAVYATVKPGSVELPLAVFEEYCLPTIKQIGLADL